MYKVNLHETSLVHKGESLYIGADISVRCNYIDPNRSIAVTPVLSCGNNSQELPLVIINGKQRHRNFKHMASFFKEYKIYKAMLAVNDSVLWCPYQLHIPYQDWMDEAELSLIAD